MGSPPFIKNLEEILNRQAAKDAKDSDRSLEALRRARYASAKMLR
jgi:hypothetical protein